MAIIVFVIIAGNLMGFIVSDWGYSDSLTGGPANAITTQ